MSNSASIQITLEPDRASLKMLERAMKKLPEAVFEKVCVGAARTAMTPMLNAMRRLVPAQHGLLRKSLSKKTVKDKGNGRVLIVLGPKKGSKDPATGANPSNYAHLVEFGTGEHVIRSRRGPKGFLKIGDRLVLGAVQHPGAREKPFMRPAFDATKYLVVQKYIATLKRRVPREVEKLSRGNR